MDLRGLFHNPRFVAVLAISALATLAYLVASLLVLGGPAVFQTINTVLPPLAALAVSWLAAHAGRVTDRSARRMWAFMALGFGLWAVADLVWLYYTYALEEAPFPSLADLLWLLAYPAVFLALASRLRTLKVAPTPRQRLVAIAGGGLAIWLTALLVLPPILADFDPTRVWEGLVNLAYPLADLGVAALTGLVLVLLKEGRFALAWRLITAGLILMTFSDLAYAYATWNGLYYPDGDVNLQTMLVDVTYVLAYAFTGFGFYLYVQVWGIKAGFDLNIETTPLENSSAFLATNREDRLIIASDNFHALRGLPESYPFEKMPLAEALGAAAVDVQALLEQAGARDRIDHRPLPIFRRGERQPVEVRVTIQVMRDPDGAYNGANLAITAPATGDASKRLPRSPEVQAMLDYLLARAGALPEHEYYAVRVYFLEIMRLLSSVLFQFGGAQYREALFGELARTIQQENLPVRLESQVFVLPESYPGDALAGCLRPLLRSARDYVAGLVGPEMVSDELNELDRQIDPGVMALVERHALWQEEPASRPYAARGSAATA